MTNVDTLFEQFIREKKYLQNLTIGTLEYYFQIYRNFKNVGAFTSLSKESINNAIIRMKERGTSANAINTYLRGLNAFLRWLHKNNHCDPIIIPLLKGEQKVLRSLTDVELKSIIAFKPKTRNEKQLKAICLAATDTGARINEILSLERSKIDLENLLITVYGKGQKERIIPFSFELRKVLFKQLSSHKFELVFSNRQGGKLGYDNMHRDFKIMAKKLGLGKEVSFHTFRRTFATNYIRHGGNPLILQVLLGHTTISQTIKYVKLVTEDLSKEQHRTSLLNRIR